jgi:hypothetical protein
VIERQRRPGERDGFLWFCERCDAELHAEYLPVENIETDLPPVFERFWASPAQRTCRRCGAVMQPPAGAAAALGVPERTLRRKMRLFGLAKEAFRKPARPRLASGVFTP